MEMKSLLQTIGSAIQEAHRAITDNNTDHFFTNYFEKRVSANGEESYRPRMIEVELPIANENGTSKVIYAPVAALLNHNSLNLDSVKLNLNLEVLNETEKGVEVSAQCSSAKSEDSKTNLGTMEIIFKCSDASEGVARIITHLNGMI
ncbi:MAG: DUF2589 domain-containing protein [Lachnospiraceae bacterium]|nr:DUF2589 domain-containing protein [Lachnospiraceae bacterium]